MRKITFIVLAVFLCIGRLNAAPGDFDLSFGENGLSLVDPTSAADGALTTLVLPDGNILVGGSIAYDETPNAYIARYLSDGTLDPTFGDEGEGGFAFFDFGSSTYEWILDMAVQEDGTIVAVGTRDAGTSDAVLVRLRPDGSHDPVLSDAGFVVLDLAPGHNDRAIAVAIDSENRIVLGGYTDAGGDWDMLVARLFPEGSLDESFDEDGVRTIDFFGDADILQDLVLTPEGKILAGGSADDGTTPRFALAQLLEDGTPDPAFGEDGLSFSPLENDHFISYLALQSDGGVLAGGVNDTGGAGDVILILRYLANGLIDESFNGTGFVLTELTDRNNRLNGLLVQDNGSIVAVGTSEDASSEHDLLLARYLPDGSPDGTFGASGIFLHDLATNAVAGAGALQPDGKILVAGGWNGSQIFLARFEGDPVETPSPAPEPEGGTTGGTTGGTAGETTGGTPAGTTGGTAGEETEGPSGGCSLIRN